MTGFKGNNYVYNKQYGKYMKLSSLSYEERSKLFFQIKNICFWAMLGWIFLLMSSCVVIDINPDYEELTMQIFFGYTIITVVLLGVPSAVMLNLINRATEKENEQIRLEQQNEEEAKRKKNLEELAHNAIPLDSDSWKQLVDICFRIAASPTKLPANISLFRGRKGSNFGISSNYYLGDMTMFEMMMIHKLDFFDRHGIYQVDINTDIQGKPVIIVNDSDTYKVGH